VYHRFVNQTRQQWKSQISAIVGSEPHECNVLSLFTNSKLFQRLLCIGVGANDLCKLQLGDGALSSLTMTDADERWLASLNGQNKSTQSSDTEAMEYEDIDRYLVSVDSAAVAKDMMEQRPGKISTSKLTLSRHLHGLGYDDPNSPSLMYKDHDPDFTLGQKLSLKIKRKYTKRKKNGLAKAKEGAAGDPLKIVKNRVVKIIDPGINHKFYLVTTVDFCITSNFYQSYFRCGFLVVIVAIFSSLYTTFVAKPTPSKWV